MERYKYPQGLMDSGRATRGCNPSGVLGSSGPIIALDKKTVSDLDWQTNFLLYPSYDLYELTTALGHAGARNGIQSVLPKRT